MFMPENLIPDLVSTVIPVKNRPNLIVAAIQSVLNQTYRPIEIIVVDDQSTDTTCEVVESMIAQFGEVIRLIRTQSQGTGPGPVREFGRVTAQGEFLQYLDSDDLLLPDKFRLQVAALRANPDCDIAYGWSREFRDGESPQNLPYKWTGRKYEYLFPALLVDRWWCTNTPLYTRRLTDRIGPWPSLRLSQDWAYDAIAGSLGAKLVQVEEYVSDFRHHDGVRQTGQKNCQSLERLQNDLRLRLHLLETAIRAGCKTGSPEMLHLSRALFMNARGLGALGDGSAAEQALKNARTAAGEILGNNLQFRVFSAVKQIIGWKAIGKLSRMRDQFCKGAGRHSMKWSWAKE